MAAKRLDMGAVRRIMEPQDPPLTSKDMAESVGLSMGGFRCARDIILLFDEELTVAEWGPVSEALREVVVGRFAAARALIDPIFLTHFGARALTGGPLATRDAVTREFLGAVVPLVDRMTMAGELPVPWMPQDQREALAHDLDVAIGNVVQLKNTILAGGNNVTE